jgi:hypothetical protein
VAVGDTVVGDSVAGGRVAVGDTGVDDSATGGGVAARAICVADGTGTGVVIGVASPSDPIYGWQALRNSRLLTPIRSQNVVLFMGLFVLRLFANHYYTSLHGCCLACGSYLPRCEQAKLATPPVEPV